jgi:hypothetical protein
MPLHTDSTTQTELKLVSFNLHGLNQGYPALADLITNMDVDVALLQEHWLTPGNLDMLDKKFDNYFLSVPLQCQPPLNRGFSEADHLEE